MISRALSNGPRRPIFAGSECNRFAIQPMANGAARRHLFLFVPFFFGTGNSVLTSTLSPCFLTMIAFFAWTGGAGSPHPPALTLTQAASAPLIKPRRVTRPAIRHSLAVSRGSVAPGSVCVGTDNFSAVHRPHGLPGGHAEVRLRVQHRVAVLVGGKRVIGTAPPRRVDRPSLD